MANLVAPMNVFPSGSGYLSQYVVGQGSNTDGTATKVHLKLNLPKTNLNGSMVMIEAVGYAYGSAQAIRSSWCFYQYQGSLYGVGVANIYPGMNAEAVYFSADNFVCLRGGLSGYYSGFVLNAHTGSGDGAGRPITLQAQAWNTNAGNFY